MTDVLMVGMLAAFFALAVVLVKACELIIGPDTEAARVEPLSAPRDVGEVVR